MHALHGLLPYLSRQTPAGHPAQGRVVVIAHPDPHHIIRSKADEPGIARGLRCAGLARHLPAGQLRPLARAFFDNFRHHPDQLPRRRFADHPLSDPAFTRQQRLPIRQQAQIGQAIGHHR